jgi:hypothetical protein
VTNICERTIFSATGEMREISSEKKDWKYFIQSQPRQTFDGVVLI